MGWWIGEFWYNPDVMETTALTAILKSGRDRSLRRRHPWVFSGAIAKVDGPPEAGDEVEVVDAGGDVIGRGLFNPHSQMLVRRYRWS